jgi:hypothetical protein
VREITRLGSLGYVLSGQKQRDLDQTKIEDFQYFGP